MDEKYTNFDGWEKCIDEKHKIRWLGKIHGKITKNPMVRVKIKVTNLTARCEPRHSTLSSWDKSYLILFFLYITKNLVIFASKTIVFYKKRFVGL